MVLDSLKEIKIEIYSNLYSWSILLNMTLKNKIEYKYFMFTPNNICVRRIGVPPSTAHLPHLLNLNC